MQCHLIASGLKSRGYNVRYVAPITTGAGGHQNAQALRLGYEVMYVRCSDHKSLTESILSCRPDVVYWRYNKNLFYKTARALSRAKVPLVFAASHINDLLVFGIKPKRGVLGAIHNIRARFKAMYEHQGFNFVGILTVNNPDLVRNSPVAESRVVRNGLFREVRKFTWPRPYCVWVGNIKASKRPEEALKIAQALRDRGVDLLMVGRLTEQAPKAFRDEKKIPPNVFLLGEREVAEVNGIFRNALVHLHTCLPEGFGNVFLQSWEQAVPSVSLGDDPGSTLTENKIGFFCSDDARVFEEQLCRLLDNPEERVAKGGLAKKYVDKYHSDDALLRGVEEAISYVIEQAKSG